MCVCVHVCEYVLFTSRSRRSEQMENNKHEKRVEDNCTTHCKIKYFLAHVSDNMFYTFMVVFFVTIYLFLLVKPYQ